MNRKRMFCLLAGLLCSICLSGCGEKQRDGEKGKEESVWVLTEAEHSLNTSELFMAELCNGTFYYLEDIIEGSLLKSFSMLDGTESEIELKWPEMWQKVSKLIPEITLDSEGNIYCITELVGRYKVEEAYLCKFDAQGEFVYSQSIMEQVREAGEERSLGNFMLKADAEGRVYLAHNYKLFLYDTNGVCQNTIPVIMQETVTQAGIHDMFMGRDGKVYLYYPQWGVNRLCEVDFENVALRNEQEVMWGKKMTFLVEDGFVISDDEGMYLYESDVPTVDRKPKEMFVWWDYLLYGKNITHLEVLEDGRIVAVLWSSSEELCHTVLIEQMSEREAKALENERIILPHQQGKK